ncbi:MAG: cation:proton antiporter, partial [Caulobacteraceae bacterium]
DAAAATAVLRQVNPPHWVTVVLEGESLLNDAAALLIYRLAVGAALASGSFHLASVAPAFLLSVAGSLIAGPLLALAYAQATRKLRDTPSNIILQFVGTFGVWILAERLGMSPILTVVAYGVTLARWAPARTPARMRIPSYAVWETVVLMLNTLAFVLIGLQLRPILASAPHGELRSWMIFAGAILLTTILVRIVWVGVHTLVLGVSSRRNAAMARRLAAASVWKSGVVIGWSGMRGIVTLAAALALPEGFAYRNLLLFTAFGVTLGTLVIQGLTLRPLLLWLDLRDDRPVDREVRFARVELAGAALAILDGEDGEEAEPLRRELRAQRDAATTAQDGEGRAILPQHHLRRRALARQREALLQLRRERRIGDDAFHRLEAELDYSELATSVDAA